MKRLFALALVAALAAATPGAALAADTLTAPCTLAAYSGMSTTLIQRNYTLVGGMPDMADMGFPLSASVYKFDISAFTAPVASAVLQVEKITGTMAPITAANPLTVTAVSLQSDAAGWSDLLPDDYGDTLASVTFGANGLYSFDITALVNAWIGGADNNGLALVTDASGFAGPDAVGYLTLAALGGTSYGDPAGASPVIVATVPEPASLALLGLGGAALAARRRKDRTWMS